MLKQPASSSLVSDNVVAIGSGGREGKGARGGPSRGREGRGDARNARLEVFFSPPPSKGQNPPKKEKKKELPAKFGIGDVVDSPTRERG